ncbi:MAG: hypothetical protein ACP5OG_01970 [Candidatus Nanoarchaeia archaeon]
MNTSKTHLELLSKGYELKAVFKYNASPQELSPQDTLNKHLLESTITNHLESKTSFAIIPAELVPESFPPLTDLTNQYAVYAKPKIPKIEHPFGEWGKAPLSYP